MQSKGMKIYLKKKHIFAVAFFQLLSSYFSYFSFRVGKISL